MKCITYKGGYKYQLKQDYRVEIPIKPKKDIDLQFIQLTATGLLTIKSGYAWDGPSGPTIDTLNFMRGSLVHDALYQLMREGALDFKTDRDTADRLLRTHCIEDGMSRLRAWWVYHALRIWGGPAADPDGKRPIKYAPQGCAENGTGKEDADMSETFNEYRDRVLGYLGDQDPLAVQEGTPEALCNAVEGLSKEALKRRPKDGGWSIIEIVLHMADAELAMGWRLKNMLATPGVKLPWFDEHQWSQALDYNQKDMLQALELFSNLRASNLELLRSVPRDTWDSFHGVHAVRGRQTVGDFVRLEAAHDLCHLRQIEGVLSATT